MLHPAFISRFHCGVHVISHRRDQLIADVLVNLIVCNYIANVFRLCNLPIIELAMCVCMYHMC